MIPNMGDRCAFKYGRDDASQCVRCDISKDGISRIDSDPVPKEAQIQQ